MKGMKLRRFWQTNTTMQRNCKLQKFSKTYLTTITTHTHTQQCSKWQKKKCKRLSAAKANNANLQLMKIIISGTTAAERLTGCANGLLMGRHKARHRKGVGGKTPTNNGNHSSQEDSHSSVGNWWQSLVNIHILCQGMHAAPLSLLN